MRVKNQLIKSSRSKKKKKNNKVVPLKTKKKTNPFVVPDDNVLLSTVSVVNITEALNKMWEKPVLNVLKEEKIKVNLDKPLSTKNKEVDLPFDVDDTANDDNILCQDLNVGLKLWLEAYCGIPNNICYLDISEEDKQIRRRAQENSQRVRKAAGKPLLSTPKWHWKQKHTDKRPRYPVPGWHGLRSPTVVQLLVQAYSKGYSFATASSRVKSITTVSIAGNTNTSSTMTKCPVVEDLEYWRYQTTLKNMSHLPEKLATPIHLTNIVKVNRIFKLREALRYDWWLYNHEALNPVVDVVPFQHRSAETGLYYGDRYEGRKAAEHASHRRHFKRNSVYGDAKWNRYLCYYYGFKNGNLTSEQLAGISRYIWEETDSCDVLVFSKIPEKAERSYCEGDTSTVLALPSPAMFDKMYPPNPLESNQDEGEIVRGIMGSLHPSGHSQDEVYHIILRHKWKKLPNMLINVPESFQEKEGNVVIPYNSSFDCKQRHLKTG